jgi:hypothetical protein
MNERCCASDAEKLVSDDTCYVEASLLCVTHLKSCVAPHLFLWRRASFFVHHGKSLWNNDWARLLCEACWKTCDPQHKLSLFVMGFFEFELT